MTTEAQIEANRRNSQHSTGPRTEAGKEASRRNALRHGLAARTLVVAPGEDAADFAAFAADLRQDLAPGGAFEEALVQRITILAWRLERVARIEAELLMAEASLVASEAGLPEPPLDVVPAELTALARYEATIDRAFERAMKMLRERQKMRLAGELPECAGEIAERSQFAPPAPAPAPEDSAERSQFPDDDDDEPVSPQEIIARREAERLERVRIIQESCRPKGAPVMALPT